MREQGTSEKLEAARIIDSPAEIALTLQRLKDANSSLNTQLSHEQPATRCCITAIDSAIHTLEIGLLAPPESTATLLTAPTKLRFACRMDGVLLNFSAERLSQGRKAEGGNMTLAFPREIYSSQKRANYRIFPRMMSRPLIQLEGPASSLRGEIANLSMSGALVLLPGNPDNEVAIVGADGRLVQCAIKFDEDSTTVTSARVCHHRRSATGYIEAGLAFLAPDRKTRLQLQRQTARIERENARWH